MSINKLVELNKRITLDEIAINIGIATFTFKKSEINETLTSLIDEMRNITADLSPEEQNYLHRIMEHKSGYWRVDELFNAFRRNDEVPTEAHVTLRKLRDAQFIRPLEGGRWHGYKHIEIKKFGELMWKKIGPETLFAKEPSIPGA